MNDAPPKNVSTSPTPAVWAVVGPTASGKSDIAMALADRVGGEIVGCDSVQVYRGFDVGSAKPSVAERARIAHHLIDVVDGHEAFDAQRYITHARAALAGIAQRGRVAVLCGGTGLYLRALRFGLVHEGGSDPTVRAELMAQEADDPGSLYLRLQKLDPVSAQRTEPKNLVHVARALEITLLSGEPASAVRARHGFAKPQVAMRVVALQWPADVLRARIEARTQIMVEAGLIKEVRALLAAGCDPACRPMRAVGYKEAVETVQGLHPEATLAARIAQSTWQYARRQRTWLRREPDVLTLPMPASFDAAHALLTRENP